MNKKIIATIIILLHISILTIAAQTYTISGIVINKEGGEAIEFAQIIASDNKNGTTSNKEGEFKLYNIPSGEHKITVLTLGFMTTTATIVVDKNIQGLIIPISEQQYKIKEIVVTASESRGLTSASHIGKDAMVHLQPSSFEDILELLPGGRAADPTFSSSNKIHLREVPTSSSDYNTSSLGVSFIVDGVPISNDASLQYQSSLTNIGSNVELNAGVDMREISTDEISSVEIIRGIPSVEYGDLTSGLVKIERKEGRSDLEARFKADLKSQLFYMGKGFDWTKGGNPLTMNVGVDFLDSRADPRNIRQNYKRLTASWRMTKRWTKSTKYNYLFGANLDYTGSFDRVKSDKNMDQGALGQPIERYSANYTSLAGAIKFSAKAKQEQLFKSFDATLSLNSQYDKVDRWRYVVNGGHFPILTDVEEGIYNAEILPNKYEATLQVDGKPFYAFSKIMALFALDTPHSSNSLRVGADWSMTKNYGEGLIYDTKRPISNMMTTRPRRYSDIPALHRISMFVEERSSLRLGMWQVETMAGLRTTTMTNLGDQYQLQGRFHFDPRVNLSISTPALMALGQPLRFIFSGGFGWHTKTPTMSQLFPDPAYYDFTQLNYFPPNESNRLINMVVYKEDPTNYELKAARNFKWEVRTDVIWGENSLAVTLFREKLSSGFRNSSSVKVFEYRDYDESAIDGSALVGPPSLEGLPYTQERVLRQIGETSNGSSTEKRGVEFTLSAKRIESLATRISVTGAYFNTTYSNSEPQYISTSMIINNRAYPYIGLYEQEDNYMREMLRTNFMFDTQIPRLGLVFSTSFQCQWFVGSQHKQVDQWPIHYMDKDLNIHPFTSASAQDGVLQHMIRTPSDLAYLYNNTPFSMFINLKVTKLLYRNKIRASLFVNRLLDYSPDYTNVSGALTRRYSSPYFGMELNFKL